MVGLVIELIGAAFTVLVRIFQPSELVRFRVAKRLGLRWRGLGWLVRGTISGELHGLSVTVRDEVRTWRERIEVTLRGVSPTMKVLPLSAIRGSMAGRVETGDAELDAQVYIEGVPAWQVLSRLDPSTRALMLRLVGCDEFVIQNGQLSRAEDRPLCDDEDLEEILLDATKLGQALTAASQADSAERLACLAREDLDHHVRRRYLQVLSSSYPDLPLTIATCREALEDASLWVKLQAAMGLGQEGLEPLRQLIDHPLCPDSIVAPGLRHLVSIAPTAAAASLMAALKTSNPIARRFAAETLGRMQHFPALDSLGTLVETADEDTAVTAAEALATIHSSKAEPSLVHALGRREPDVRRAAARALERVGTVESVPSLRSLADGSGVDRGVRNAARDAVRAIQARLSGAEAGLLAVAGTNADEGQLALAPEQCGEVSLESARAPRRTTTSSSA